MRQPDADQPFPVPAPGEKGRERQEGGNSAFGPTAAAEEKAAAAAAEAATGAYFAFMMVCLLPYVGFLGFG